MNQRELMERVLANARKAEEAIYIPFVADPRVPPGEIHVMQGGVRVGRIIGLDGTPLIPVETTARWLEAPTA